MRVALRVRQEVLAEVKIMEIITNWEVFNSVSLAFCQFQGLLWIIALGAIAIFKYNLGEVLSVFK
jgi:hypothetical protein